MVRIGQNTYERLRRLDPGAKYRKNTRRCSICQKPRKTFASRGTENYIIASGSENIINPNDVLTKYVQKGTQKIEGGSDRIYFKLSSSTPSGVTTIRDEETNLIIGFTASSDVTNGNYVEVYPVARMDGYEPDDEKYASKIIRIHFVKKYETLELSSKDVLYNLEEVGLKNNPITLIANDITLQNGIHRFNSLPVLVANAGWQNFYLLDVDCNSTSISVEKTNEENSSAVIVAHEYSNKAEEVVFTLKTKYPGNIDAVSRTIYVKGDDQCRRSPPRQGSARRWQLCPPPWQEYPPRQGSAPRRRLRISSPEGTPPPCSPPCRSPN